MVSRAEDERTPRPVGHRTARTAAFIAGAELVGKVASLLYVVVAARLLVQGDFGAFNYAVSLSLLVQTLPLLGFDAVLTRQGSRDASTLPVRLAENLLWRLVIAVPTFGVAAALALSGRPSRQAQVVLVLVFAAALLDLHDHTWRAAAAALQRQVGSYAALVVQRVLTAVLAVVALTTGGGVVDLAAAYLAGSVAGTAMLLGVSWRLGLRARLSRIRPAGMLVAGRESVVLGASAIVLAALFRLDIVMLEALRGDRVVAVYSVAYRLVETVMFLSWAVSRATFPVMSGAAVDSGTVRAGLERGLQAVWFFYAPFCAIALVRASAVLDLVFGAPYGAEAATALRWLAPAPMLIAVGFLGAKAMIARGHDVQTLAAAVVATVSNVALNLIFIPQYAEVAAAAATVVSYAVQVVVIRWSLRRLLPGLSLLPRMVEAGAASTVLAVVLLVTPLPLPAALAVGGICYLATWYGLAAVRSPEQIVLLRSLLPRRGHG